jgi:hypothetical protein
MLFQASEPACRKCEQIPTGWPCVTFLSASDCFSFLNFRAQDPWGPFSVPLDMRDWNAIIPFIDVPSVCMETIVSFACDRSFLFTLYTFLEYQFWGRRERDKIL